ncbi:tyrosine-protein phosphatase [Saccharopolyspora dendranthemae]|uniref:Protein tyrosine/serine phosphatase n=1 Tax=Saccharopolyspora dendranthemae TaxID=1181886 RepID=A0A561VBT1_9PSEU|nr:tyrosine-protein phosphatase [Saccharopolyspora dendranthemae]TWG09074.1 protein tyrosine/serine phosphatase [Saccharopolyspora dendranthemae]
MSAQRILDFEGMVNARDLGGVPVAGGRVRWGAVVRAEHPARLTAVGWERVWQHGVRTIIDLTGPGEEEPERAPRPAGLSTIRIALDDTSDTEFWDRWGGAFSCTPLYFGPFLDRYPQLVGEVAGAIADAEPGGVLVHCGGGRDRTGLICLVLLAALGASARDIAEDYAISHRRRAEQCAASGMGDDTGKVEQFLTQQGTTERDALDEVLGGRDFAAYLKTARVLGESGFATLRERLLEPA